MLNHTFTPEAKVKHDIVNVHGIKVDVKPVCKAYTTTFEATRDRSPIQRPEVNFRARGTTLGRPGTMGLWD